MSTETLSTETLSTEMLTRRLGQLALAERRVQVEFLLHLDEFDRRRAYLEAGYGSLWEYCLRALHLREGSAGRRIGAMRVLRRFPTLTKPLRDGRLCLSTVSLLGQVLTNENLDELVGRAAHKTKEEVDHLVASLRPRSAPREGVRQLPNTPVRLDSAVPVPLPLRPASPSTDVPPLSARPNVAAAMDAVGTPHPNAAPHAGATGPGTVEAEAEADPRGDGASATQGGRPAIRVRAVSETQWSLTVTLDVAAKKDLELLGALLSHKCGRDLSAVLREAIRCGIEKHGKRRGAVPTQRNRRASAPKTSRTATERETAAAPPGTGARASPSREPPRDRRSRCIPAQIRREVFERDGGSCTWIGNGGRRCGSRHQVEVDHIHPFELGGPSTVPNLRLLCKPHNLLWAEQVFGREHMSQFTRRDAKHTIARESGVSAGGRDRWREWHQREPNGGESEVGEWRPGEPNGGESEVGRARSLERVAPA